MSGDCYVDKLRRSPTSSLAQWNLFLQQYDPSGDRIFAFVEGRDDPAFYGTLLRQPLPMITWINCLDNKQGVRWAMDRFLAHFRQASPRALFFMDRDFDDYRGIEASSYKYLFVTRWYSIESYLIAPEVAFTYLVEAGALDALGNSFRDFAAFFNEHLNRFLTVHAPIAEWMLSVRLASLRANFNALDKKGLLIWNSDQVQLAVPPDQIVSTLRQRCGKNGPVPIVQDVVRAQGESIVSDHTQWRSWARGKQVLWWLVQFLRYMQASLRTGSGGGGKVRVDLSTSNALQLLVPYLQMPSDLHDFVVEVMRDLDSPKGL
ncbi:MAG: DUF4435 domain-containing protein [Myxococcales bacterium]|nr:DUF4435 domain-containing protein [Myxococcales bacterium]